MPGAADAGPFNPRFVQDVGAAYLIGGLALAARAWRGRYWPAALTGSGFFALHALVHVMAMGRSQTMAFELALVVLPAALALYASLPDKGESHA